MCLIYGRVPFPCSRSSLTKEIMELKSSQSRPALPQVGARVYFYICKDGQTPSAQVHNLLYYNTTDQRIQITITFQLSFLRLLLESDQCLGCPKLLGNKFIHNFQVYFHVQLIIHHMWAFLVLRQTDSLSLRYTVYNDKTAYIYIFLFLFKKIFPLKNFLKFSIL